MQSANSKAISNRKSYEKSKRKAQALRNTLIAKLGGKCVWNNCGTTVDLTFDHPKGRTYDITHLSTLQRMVRYTTDLHTGNLRLLCRRHNSLHGFLRTVSGIEKKYKSCECNFCKNKKKKNLKKYFEKF